MDTACNARSSVLSVRMRARCELPSRFANLSPLNTSLNTSLSVPFKGDSQRS